MRNEGDPFFFLNGKPWPGAVHKLPAAAVICMQTTVFCLSQHNLTRKRTRMSAKMSPVFSGGSILEVWRSKSHPFSFWQFCMSVLHTCDQPGNGHEQHHQGLGRQGKCPILLVSVKMRTSVKMQRAASPLLILYQGQTEVL